MTAAAAGYLAVAFVVMTLLGYFSIVLLCRDEISTKVALGFAPPVGMGLVSIVFFTFRRPMFTVELSLLVVLFGLWLRYRKRTLPRSTKQESLMPSTAGWMIGAMAWVALASFIWIQHGPHGEWDGRVIWNSKARYMFRVGPFWMDHIIDTTHSDYPLLQPSATARAWRYVGEDIPEIGGIQLVLIALSGAAVLAACLWELRRSSVSFLMALLLISTPAYSILAVQQYADIPLAVYILSTVGLLCIYWDRAANRGGLLALAGFTAGCAAWTKNEGLLFLVSTYFILLLPLLRQPTQTIRRLALFSLGVCLPLAVTLYFKFTVPAANDIINSGRTSADLISKILDSSRYVTIGTAFVNVAGTFGRWVIHPAIPLLALLLTWGIDRRVVRSAGWITGAGIVLVVLTGYFAIYVITHQSLVYHLTSSLDRLFMHLWPTLLLLAGLAVNEESP
jgi:hypothetical protein